jgi:HEPN domain-containing protein
MVEIDSKNYIDWIKKADEDVLSVSSILRHRDAVPSLACFLCHQITEKYLKGLLVFNNKNFPKIHDLLELQTLLLEFYPDIRQIDSELDLLSTYYFETRYPGDFQSFAWEEAEEASMAAEKVKNFVLGKIKSEHE